MRELSALPQERSVACPECSYPMRLRPSRYGLFYGCSRFPECKATHGAHPDGRPLGIPATGETKQARIRAHAAFDRIWRSRGWDRNAAYKWLSEQLKIKRALCHIGRFDTDTCDRVVAVCTENEVPRRFRGARKARRPIPRRPRDLNDARSIMEDEREDQDETRNED